MLPLRRLLLLSMAGVAALSGAIISDNLAAASGGSETVSPNIKLAADFNAGSASQLLSSVTLLLQQDTAGSASVALYGDNSGAPGSLIGTLASPATYTSALTNTTFSTPGISLSANTTYWIVLSALSGSFDWSWTVSNTGSGSGFLGDSALNDGTYWYSTYGIYPYQMRVTTADTTTTPEPSSTVMAAIACSAGLWLVRRARKF